jgi:hypothetical protein
MEENCIAENIFTYHLKVLLLDEQNAHDSILLFMITQNFRAQALDSQTALIQVHILLKWSEVSYGEVLRDKNTMYIRVTLYWGYLTVLWLFHLLYILYCGCFNLFCNVWVCVCVGFVMCGCFDNCMGVLIIYELVFIVSGTVCTVFVLFHVCIFIPTCFVCTSVRTTATEWKLNCSK